MSLKSLEGPEKWGLHTVQIVVKENIFRNWQDIEAAQTPCYILQGDLTVNPQGRLDMKKDSFHWDSCPTKALKWEQWWEAFTVVGLCGVGCLCF